MCLRTSSSAICSSKTTSRITRGRISTCDRVGERIIGRLVADDGEGGATVLEGEGSHPRHIRIFEQTNPHDGGLRSCARNDKSAPRNDLFVGDSMRGEDGSREGRSSGAQAGPPGGSGATTMATSCAQSEGQRAFLTPQAGQGKVAKMTTSHPHSLHWLRPFLLAACGLV